MTQPAYPVTGPGPSSNYATFSDVQSGVVTAVDLEGYQGDERALVIPLDRADGSPLPLLGQGWRADAQVRRHPTPMSPLLHGWSTHGQEPGAQFVELPPVEGHEGTAHYGLELSCADSRAWDWCGIPAGWDLHLTDPDGNSSPVAAGAAFWHPAYTWPITGGAP